MNKKNAKNTKKADDKVKDDKSQDMPEELEKKKEEQRKKRELLSRLKKGGKQNQAGKIKNTNLVQRYSGQRGN